MQNKVLILDFGSQVTQLIARRVRELNIYCEIHPYNSKKFNVDDFHAVILSGSPYSVRNEDAPHPDLSKIKGKKPLLGICYGAQYLVHFFGGKVGSSSSREYGRANLSFVDHSNELFDRIEKGSQVWMSHSDTIIEMPDNQWGFIVADAEGHSTPAAVLMAMTCSLLHSYSGTPDEPGDVITHINKTLCKVAEPSFVTALYAVFDANQRTLRFSRAGHPPPMVYRRAENKSIELTSEVVHPMGIYPYDHVPVNEAKLGPGDRLLFYTDGISERFDLAGNAYGENRLLRQLAADSADNPRQVLDAIIEDVEQFAGGRPPDDDQALVLGIVA